MFKNKRAVVEISTYSFILLILIVLFSFVYSISETYKSNVDFKNSQKKVYYSLMSLRSNLINLISQINSTYTYNNKYIEQGIYFKLQNSNISGYYSLDSNLINITLGMYGISFCSNYTIYPSINSTFLFNGSCILKVN